MSTPLGLQIVKRACEEQRLNDSLEEVVSCLLADGGVDTQCLAATDIIDGIANAGTARWDELLFSMRELIAQYATLPGGDWTSIRSVSLIACIVVLSWLTRRRYVDLDHILRSALVAVGNMCQERLDAPTDSAVEALRLLLNSEQ